MSGVGGGDRIGRDRHEQENIIDVVLSTDPENVRGSKVWFNKLEIVSWIPGLHITIYEYEYIYVIISFVKKTIETTN